MITWAGLFRRIDQLDPLDRRAAAERTEFERWVTSAEQRVMRDLAEVAKNRSRETLSTTGVAVDVCYRSRDPSLLAFGGAGRIISLSFAGSSVHLYSTRSPGEAPHVHFVCQRAPTSSRFPVVVTLPGCLVVRADDATYRLVSLPDRGQTDPDALVLRAFVLLFGAIESVSRAEAPTLAAAH